MPKCKSCGADIDFMKMESGRKMPVDSNPIKVVVIHKNGARITLAYMPHWATCTDPGKHRKTTGKG